MWQLGRELEQRGMLGGLRFDAACDEFFADVLGPEVVAGDPSGKQPLAVPAGIGSLPAASHVFLNESVEGFGHLHGRAVEGDEDSVVSHVDLGAPHATDCVRDCANKSMKRPPMRVL